MSDRYPPGGCVLRDKTKCKLRPALCCDEGRAARREQQVRMVEHGREVLKGYDCPDHPGPLDDARDHICRLRPIRCTCPLGCNAPWQEPGECPMHAGEDT